MWERVAPLLPPPRPHRRGGRPFATDRARSEGIVYLPRNGLRWRHMPTSYERRCHLYDGFVSLACALVALINVL
jgi:transposase